MTYPKMSYNWQKKKSSYCCKSIQWSHLLVIKVLNANKWLEQIGSMECRMYPSAWATHRFQILFTQSESYTIRKTDSLASAFSLKSRNYLDSGQVPKKDNSPGFYNCRTVCSPCSFWSERLCLETLFLWDLKSLSPKAIDNLWKSRCVFCLEGFSLLALVLSSKSDK